MQVLELEFQILKLDSVMLESAECSTLTIESEFKGHEGAVAKMKQRELILPLAILLLTTTIEWERYRKSKDEIDALGVKEDEELKKERIEKNA